MNIKKFVSLVSSKEEKPQPQTKASPSSASPIEQLLTDAIEKAKVYVPDVRASAWSTPQLIKERETKKYLVKKYDLGRDIVDVYYEQGTVHHIEAWLYPENCNYRFHVEAGAALISAGIEF
jgi:hypothetical protein